MGEARVASHRSADDAILRFGVAEAPGDGEVSAITIDDVLSEFNHRRIGVLKLDIEGAEREVRSMCRTWINEVDTIVVELHDRFRPGCSQALEEAMRIGGYTQSAPGENVVLRRIGAASSSE